MDHETEGSAKKQKNLFINNLTSAGYAVVQSSVDKYYTDSSYKKYAAQVIYQCENNLAPTLTNILPVLPSGSCEIQNANRNNLSL